MTEQNTQTLILLDAVKQRTTLFRNNTGMGWQGNSVKKGALTIIENARPLHAGLCEGSSDLIGFKTVLVTPEMVGQPIAVFVAIEVKSDKGRATAEQLNFISRVKTAGGLAGIARSIDEFREIIGR